MAEQIKIVSKEEDPPNNDEIRRSDINKHDNSKLIDSSNSFHKQVQPSRSLKMRNSSMIPIPMGEDSVVIMEDLMLQDRIRLESSSVFTKGKSKKELSYQLKEALDPTFAMKMGHTGWIGFDMFCGYNDLVSSRNSRIFSQASRSWHQTKSEKSSQVPTIGTGERTAQATHKYSTMMLDKSPSDLTHSVNSALVDRNTAIQNEHHFYEESQSEDSEESNIDFGSDQLNHSPMGYSSSNQSPKK